MKKELEAIIQIVSVYTGVSVDDIKCNKRLREFVWARHAFCYMARIFTVTSLTDIGRFISKDHTTVIHAISRTTDLIQADEKDAQRLNKLQKIIEETQK